jgi:hypothetical protein
VTAAQILAAFAGQDAVFLAALVIFGKVALKAADRARLAGPAKTSAAEAAAQDAPEKLPSILDRPRAGKEAAS